jgi:hypothetical protein
MAAKIARHTKSALKVQISMPAHFLITHRIKLKRNCTNINTARS